MHGVEMPRPVRERAPERLDVVEGQTLFRKLGNLDDHCVTALGEPT
jgi:hypothetical protein